jgi:hypothetical protein
MNFKDKVNCVGQFSIKSIDENNKVIDEYTEKNLIMDEARVNMAQLIGGVSSSSDPINLFVIGTAGHVGTDILDYKKVGENFFDSTREGLYSEIDPNDISGGLSDVTDAGYNYRISFNPDGDADLDLTPTGTMYNGVTVGATDGVVNTINRLVVDRTVTYTITIPATNGNSNDLGNPLIAYTEAALYASGSIFSMKCFPARVKEDTVKFVIVWSIIF